MLRFQSGPNLTKLLSWSTFLHHPLTPVCTVIKLSAYMDDTQLCISMLPRGYSSHVAADGIGKSHINKTQLVSAVHSVAHLSPLYHSLQGDPDLHAMHHHSVLNAVKVVKLVPRK